MTLLDNNRDTRSPEALPPTVTVGTGAWQATDALFKAALAMPSAERVRWVESADVSPTIKATVLRLLAADEAAANFLAMPLAGAQPAEQETEPRKNIGPYRLVGVAGRGGMGTAYLAERDDKAFDRRVVIKLLRHDVSSPRHRRYLEAERRHLAKLEHPNVARLYDGGTTEDGHPYLVIEHVDGLPIDLHCAQHSLTIAVRLRLFLQLCDAVHFAHRHLLIHCNLKPANVLVDGGGVVKLLDFGIARLQSQTPEPTPVGPTVRSPMTPRYASPEQMHGEPLSIATDVYALGVLLFELLAGASPYPAIDTPQDLEQAICVLPRPRPSTANHNARVSPQQRSVESLPPEIPRPWRRDLDHIVARAMAKAPDERFASAEQLADDIRRCLDHRPVRATPASTIDQGRKFVRRNRLGVTTAFIVASGLIVALVVLASKNRAIEHQRRQAEQTKTFLEDMITGANPRAAQATEAPTVLSMLDRAAASLAEGMADPVSEASVATTLARAYIDLGRERRAAKVLGDTAERLGDRLPPFASETLTFESMCGRLFERFDSLDDAELVLRTVVTKWHRVGGDRHPEFILNQGYLANVWRRLGRFDEAETLARSALEVGRDVLANDVRLAKLQSVMAGVLSHSDHHTEAEKLFREALQHREHHLGRHHVEVAGSLNNLGTALSAQDRHTEATAAWQEALAIWADLLPNQAHPMVSWTLHNVAGSALTERDFVTAEQAARRSLQLGNEAYEDPEADAAPTVGYLAKILHLQGRLEEAEAMARRGLDLFDLEAQRTQSGASSALARLAHILIDRGKLEEAEPLLLRAIAIQDATLPRGHSARSFPFLIYGKLAARRSAHDHALVLRQRALDLRSRSLSPEHWVVAESRSALGDSLTALGRADEARPHLEAAYAVLLRRFGAEDDRTLRALERLEALPKINLPNSTTGDEHPPASP